MTKPGLATALASCRHADLRRLPPSPNGCRARKLSARRCRCRRTASPIPCLLGPGGQAQITTPGGTVIPATWTAANGQLCLNTGAAQECWAYTNAFQPGQPLTLTSNCGTASWLANSTNAPPPPVAAASSAARGRTGLGYSAPVDIAGGRITADQEIARAAAGNGAAEPRRRRPDYLAVVADLGPVAGSADRWEYSGAEGGLLRRPAGDHLRG